MPGNLRIGATADIAELKAGMADGVEAVREAARNMAVSFEEVKGRTKAAWAGLGEDVKAGAAKITQAQLDVAAATKAHVAAITDLKRVYTISKGDTVTEAQGLALLASAQTKAAESAATLAVAKKAEAADVEAANLREGLSENALVARIQLAGREVAASMEGMRERIVLAGATGEFSLRDYASAFSGLGEIVGGAVVAGGFAHFVGELARSVDELGHLSVSSGIAITNLAGLQEIVKEMGVDWDPVAMGVVRLQRAIVQAQYGMVDYQRAFNDIGVTMDQLKDKTPDQQLQVVASALAHTAETGRVADASLTLFSRSGMKLIPVLKEQGDKLTENSVALGKQTGVTEQADEAATRWIRDTTKLTMQWHALLIPVMESFEDFAASVSAAWEGLMLGLATAVAAPLQAFKSFVQNVLDLVPLLKDVTHLDWGAFERDQAAVNRKIVDDWKDNFKQIGEGWKKLFVLPSGADEAALVKRGAVNPNDMEPGFKRDQAELYQMKLDHDVSLDEEIKFWEDKKNAAAKGSAEYEAIVKTLVGLVTKTRKEGGGAAGLRGADEQELNLARLNAARHGYAMSLSDEDHFWQQKLDKAKQGTAEYGAIVAKLAEIKERELRADRKPTNPRAEMQVVNPDISGAMASMDADLEAEARRAQQSAKLQTEAYREGAEEQVRIAEEDYRDREEDLRDAVAQHEIGERQMTQATIEAMRMREAAEQQAMRMKQMLDMGNVAAYQRDLNQEQELHRRFVRELQQANAQIAANWKQTFVEMQRDMTAAVGQWVQTGRGFQQSMAQIWGGIANNFAQNVTKMMAQELLAALTHKDVLKQEIFAEAKANAASGFRWGMKYGGPAAPVLAPVAAAAAFAGTMAFESFDLGGVVGNRMGFSGMGAHVPVLAEAGERVLSQSQTKNFETLINTRNEGARSSSVNVGPVTQNFHDSKPSPREMQRSIQSLARNGKLRLRY